MSNIQHNQESPEAIIPNPQVSPEDTTTTIDESWTEIGPGTDPIVNPSPDTLPETQIDTQIVENKTVVSETEQPAKAPTATETPVSTEILPPAETPVATVLGETIEVDTVDASKTQDSNAEVGVPKEAGTQAEHTPAKIGVLGGVVLLAAGVVARLRHNKNA